MPNVTFSGTLHGIKVRQTTTAPETHVDIHPLVFAKMLQNMTLADAVDILKRSEPFPGQGTYSAIKASR